MRRLTDGERDILREQEQDVSDLDGGGFDPDEWCPADVPVSVPVVVYSPPTATEPEFPLRCDR
jgi:hypothetical protein